MKFKEYLTSLNKLATSNPEALEMDIVYSKDDEGNGFKHVHYNAKIGEFDGRGFDGDSKIKNSVCIN